MADTRVKSMKHRKLFTILINSIIAITSLVIATSGIVLGAGEGQVGNYVIGLGYLKPYTMDSNILTGMIAALIVVYSIRNGAKNRIPRWLMRAYLMGTTCLGLTFLIAAAFLAPMQVMAGRNYFIMFSGDMFFFHFLNPVLATISYVFLLRDNRCGLTDRLLGIFPTIVYSVVYFVMVVVLKRWEDFYHFTFGGKYYLIPLVVAVIYGAAYLISYMLTRLHNHFVN